MSSSSGLHLGAQAGLRDIAVFKAPLTMRGGRVVRNAALQRSGRR
jgi:hypothetical protein